MNFNKNPKTKTSNFTKIQLKQSSKPSNSSSTHPILMNPELKGKPPEKKKKPNQERIKSQKALNGSIKNKAREVPIYTHRERHKRQERVHKTHAKRD